MNRSQLGILAAIVLALAGCKVQNMSQDAETLATLPVYPILMPSWDQRPRVALDSSPIQRKSSPCFEFLLTLPLMPVFLPAWEEDRPPLTAWQMQERGGWWRYRVASIPKTKKKEKPPEATSLGAAADVGAEGDAAEADADAEGREAEAGGQDAEGYDDDPEGYDAEDGDELGE